MTANLSSLWDFITEITDHTDLFTSIIILVVILFICKKFGLGLANLIDDVVGYPGNKGRI